MPRPERPLDDTDGPVAQLAADLRSLREKAGKPGYRQMSARVNYSVATLSAAASGRRLPTLEVTLAYVTACDGDTDQWEQRWREAERSIVTPEPVATGGRTGSPYPGLAMFQADDAELFFGRDALVDELAGRLGRRRFLVVFGASGAGKSSLVRAGLAPAVGGPMLVLTPGVHPMAELAVHLARHAGVPAGGVLEDLRADPERALLLVRQGLHEGPGQSDLLVVVDQFEETFAACADPAERADFVAALLAMCREPDGRARVVLAVRADHYARFTEYPRLLAALTDAQVLVGGMSPAELREAVTKPAERYGARVEGALVATIVAEVAGSPGALPLAAHALREAWLRCQGAMVTLAGYQAAGGVAGAVAHTAEHVYERLTDPERLVAQRMLLRMVDIGSDGLITRRRLSRTELDVIGPAAAVIEAFACARLVTVDRDTVQIAHEALIRAWPRLCGWVEESRTGLRLHRQLTEAAAVWAALNRDEGALYRGLRLSATVEAVDAAVIDPAGTEQEFLEASRALRERETRLRQRRNRRLSTALAAVATVVCLLAAGAAVSARHAAAERDRAMARELAAAARAERMTDPELALLLAARAYRLHPDPETESVLRQATADAQSTFTMDAHDAEVHSVAVSGSRIASADLSGVVKVWDPQGRTPPDTAPVPGDHVDAGPGGRLAVAFNDPKRKHSRIALWQPGAADARRLLPVVQTTVSDVAFSADGHWVAALGADSRIHVWDTTREWSIRSLPYAGSGGDIAFGPDGRLVHASDNGGVQLWDIDAATPPVVIRRPEKTLPTAVAFSPDGRRIAVAGAGRVTVWPAGGGGTPEVYSGPELGYTSVAFSPDGRRIAAGTQERTVRIWDATDRTHGRALRGHHGAVRDLAFSPDGRRLVSGGDDATVHVWDVTAATPAPSSIASGGAAMLSDDGSRTAAPTAPGTIGVLPSRPPLAARTLRHAPPDPRLLAVGTGGNGVVALHDSRIYWWQPVTGDRPAVLGCGDQPEGPIRYRASTSADGRALAVDCGDGEIRVWRDGDPRTAARIAGAGPVAISPDASLVAVFQDSWNVTLWDPAADRVVRTLQGRSVRAEHIRFSPDGRLLAVAGDDGAIRVWNVTGNQEPAVLTGTVDRTAAIAFSSDGSLIAGVGTDDVVRLWRTDGTGEALAFEHPAATRQIAFSADNRQLISLHEATVRFTPCQVCGPIDEVLALAGQRTTRDFTPKERAKYLREDG
jgi:WD40 repeat protein